MSILLPIIFFGAVFVQLIYILFVFTKLIRHSDYSIQEPFPPVSIIIAASDELENIKELVPILSNQDYPEFEILVSDDRSNDGTYDYLLFNKGKIKHLDFLRIKDLPDHYTAKKYAVTMAVKKSKYDTLLFTDADCRPTSDQWIKSMVSQFNEGKEAVLGFSRYKEDKTTLNQLIRFETFQTALQYFSFALIGMPFMGVGRNLMYKKKTFWKNNGFAKHSSLLSGDDDLFINQVAEKHNVAIATEDVSHTVSIPKATWKDWYVQKVRHLSVGKRYKFKDRLNLAFLWLSSIFVWLLFIPVFFLDADWFVAPEWFIMPNEVLKNYGLAQWYPFNNWMRLVLGIFAVWFLLRWIVLSMANKKLSTTINSWKIPYYDVLYCLYLVILGVITSFKNPQKIKWR